MSAPIPVETQATASSAAVDAASASPPPLVCGGLKLRPSNLATGKNNNRHMDKDKGKGKGKGKDKVADKDVRSRAQPKDSSEGWTGWRELRRKENDNLAGVPNVKGPERCDRQIGHAHEPNYPDYDLASLWDTNPFKMCALLKDEVARKERKDKDRRAGIASGDGISEVPKSLRQQAKRNRGVKGMVREIEVQVRELARKSAEAGSCDGCEGCVFKEPLFLTNMHDERSAYRRSLAHTLCKYYGLDSWSMDVGDAGESETCVTIMATLPSKFDGAEDLPRPMWELL